MGLRVWGVGFRVSVLVFLVLRCKTLRLLGG